MKGTAPQEVLTVLSESLGDRVRPRDPAEPPAAGALASVLPMNAGEVELLARVADSYSAPLVVVGGGTGGVDGGTAGGAKDGSILVHFDLMRSTRLPRDPEEPWAEAEPGALWLQLDNELRLRGRGLAVYPTSAPRATVGGWLATDGLGVGSFEYGWLRDNVLSARVVPPGGETVEIPGEELRSAVGEGGIVVSARLRTRAAGSDTPFAAALDGAQDVNAAVADLMERRADLWHLAFLNPAMAAARGLGEDYLLFGAYPADRAERAEADLRASVEGRSGRMLDASRAGRVWGERFFPIAPSRPAPDATRRFVPLADLPSALDEVEKRPETALQGTISRSGDVLLLSFDAREDAASRG